MASSDTWWSTLKRIKFLSYPVFILLSGPRMGGGGLLPILISGAEEEEGVLNSKLEWI